MNLTNLSSRYKQFGGLAVAAVILTVIVLPLHEARAFTADLTLPDTDPSHVPISAEGSTFLVTIDIAPGELISMSEIEVILDNETPQVKQAIFDASGQHVSGDPAITIGNLKINVPSDTLYGYGYGYGMISYGTSFAPPYSYSFTSLPGFLSGNEYGYSYAVANANLVNGFLGPATITIEGKLNTSLLAPGTHTLDVLVHTGSGGNNFDKIVPPQLVFNVAEPTEAVLIVESADLEGNLLNGVWTTIRSADGSNMILKLGFSPLTFIGEPGESYRVTVADYDGRVFQHWEDSSVERTRTIELQPGETTITATHDLGDSLRGFTSLTYPETEQVNHSLTVNATTLDGAKSLSMYVIIDPQSSDGSSTTYAVYMHNYLDKIFRHWEDGNLNSVRTVTIHEDTTITAFYKIDDDAEENPQATFSAPLHGSQEVPPVSTTTTGQTIFILSEDGTELKYSLIVSQIDNITQAHIHLGAPGVNGPVAAFLFDLATPDSVSVNGLLVQGTITSSDLVGPLAGETLSELIEHMNNNNAYVNVHTTQNPAGEIRGQILPDN